MLSSAGTTQQSKCHHGLNSQPRSSFYSSSRATSVALEPSEPRQQQIPPGSSALYSTRDSKCFAYVVPHHAYTFLRAQALGPAEIPSSCSRQVLHFA